MNHKGETWHMFRRGIAVSTLKFFENFNPMGKIQVHLNLFWSVYFAHFVYLQLFLEDLSTNLLITPHILVRMCCYESRTCCYESFNERKRHLSYIFILF